MMTNNSNYSPSDGPKRIAFVSDAWFPQINGVVRTLDQVTTQLRTFGHEVHMITPDQFRTIACPTYPEIRLSIDAAFKVSTMLDNIKPDIIHIATEGPLGFFARRYCVKHGLNFTTSFHTKFAEYIQARFGFGEQAAYRFLRWFHKPSHAMMTATPTLKHELEARGFTNCTSWTRGVDTELFNPDKRGELPYPSPIYLYVGRVAVEKNIEAFLSLDLDGTKLVVGDGPARKELEARYGNAVFVGAKKGEELAHHYASADVFVFPSKTDTFGLVMLEALASGTPVAAYPVTGPVDVITDEKAGSLQNDLLVAIKTAKALDREDCRHYALGFSWENCARMLEKCFIPAG